MSKEAMKLALEALNESGLRWPNIVEAIKVLEEALAKQGEPVAWYVDFGNEHEPNYFVFGAKPDDEPTATVRPLVFGDTTPQPRKWVGLTHEEAAECWTYNDKTSWKNIEAKLKELNT